MNAVDPNNVLNEFVAMHYRSLARYLTYASPAWHRGDEKARETLAAIADDHGETADRLAAFVIDNGGGVDNSRFPIYYTAFHDLSFDFLLNELIKEQQQHVVKLERSVEALNAAPMAQALVQEALGAAKGHLESLEEFKRPAAA